MRRVYIAGPMSGLPEHNFPAFHEMAAGLRAEGFDVVNPAELNEGGKSWADCMRTDIAQLVTCDSVVTLPGWTRSKGASLEVDIARQLGMTIIHKGDLREEAAQGERCARRGGCFGGACCLV